ncbi:hypothetical protein C8Q69DRAFT_461546 [Paecilomyces variotii]|uniref:Uncharacterized protein n=1 Tax=Byssochlamys spectabilis TaxID=264951 RepID=A0A443HYF5_BYSSP|nr:hypothetical protein C8Q69DRAFT_461546 [Paecilomyces variotii]RWQ96877.1 hypothetical protein C8Q69DRAFT_461546 [Paecilomyces variotii]
MSSFGSTVASLLPTSLCCVCVYGHFAIDLYSLSIRPSPTFPFHFLYDLVGCALVAPYVTAISPISSMIILTGQSERVSGMPR